MDRTRRRTGRFPLSICQGRASHTAQRFAGCTPNTRSLWMSRPVAVGFRWTLLRLGPDRFIWSFQVHHLLMDGYSRNMHLAPSRAGLLGAGARNGRSLPVRLVRFISCLTRRPPTRSQPSSRSTNVTSQRCSRILHRESAYPRNPRSPAASFVARPCIYRRR